MTDSVFIPPEWAPQSALWVGWPRLPGEWGDAFDGARTDIARFIRAAAVYLPVKVACGSDDALISARDMCHGVPAISFHPIPTGDIWLRDTGPLIGRRGADFIGACFGFNGWGGKYLMPGDTDTNTAICALESATPVIHDIILEGGSIDLDGEGLCLTTRECLLNPNRNSGWTEAAATARLKSALGLTRLIWLGEGLHGDHTDGHVDNIARFVAPGHAVCQHASGADDPNADRLAAIERDLRAAGLSVSTIPSPGLILDGDGASMPASHMNFTITNKAVLVPIYEDAYSARAVKALAALFPGRTIVPLPAHNILSGGGSFHCMTREVPYLGPSHS